MDTKQDKSAMQCVNCPGRTDHSTADCPTLRALLTAQPQASADKDVHTEHCCKAHGCKYNDPACTVAYGDKAQSFPCEDCSEDAQPQASAAQSAPSAAGPAERCDACQGLTLGLTGEQKWCCYCGNRLTGDYVDAAQSAPAGEREAFEEAATGFSLSLDESTHRGTFYEDDRTFWMHRGWQARASWQRAQSAPVAPEGERLADLLESVWMGDDEAKPHGIGATYWNNAVIACKVAIRDALAAAPAQPAAQETCQTCNGVGIVGHSELCPECKGAPQPAAQRYVIVPVDPTPKMLAAYMETDGAVKRWKAMVAAAKAEGVHV